jgi:hypothetical protein
MAAKEQKPAATTKRSTTTKAKATTTTRRATTSRRKAAPVITDEMVAERAYWISQSDECGSDVDNWLRAEAELQTA